MRHGKSDRKKGVKEESRDRSDEKKRKEKEGERRGEKWKGGILERREKRIQRQALK